MPGGPLREGGEELEEAAEEIRAAGGVAQAVAADMSDPNEIEKLAEETVSRCGGIDILVNKAGGIGSPSPFEELSDEDWLGVLGLNLLSAVRLTRAVLPYMRERGLGRIVNIASESGIQPDPFHAPLQRIEGSPDQSDQKPLQSVRERRHPG